MKPIELTESEIMTLKMTISAAKEVISFDRTTLAVFEKIISKLKND